MVEEAMNTAVTWLADVLDHADCRIVELPGWQTRGRSGAFGPAKGVLCHHTAGPKGTSSLETIIEGRPDLPGPLAHLYLDPEGVFTIVAAGRCNHAGIGSWQGITSGNTYFIGIEAENDGLADDPWPDVQYQAYARGCAAILNHIGAPVIMCAGHKEYALPPGRKVDPSFNLTAFRALVSVYMKRLAA
jgi:hypothetical protein